MKTKKNIKLHIKKGDTVEVISGDNKGSQGVIKQIFPNENRAIVEGLNMVKRHIRPSAESPGGVFEKEAPIHISNLMLVDADGVASKTKIEVRDEKKVRVSKKTNQVID
jgi:large subunit ribosomal protein L24